MQAGRRRSTASSTSRSRDSEAPPGAAPADALRAAAPARRRRSAADNVVIDGGERIPVVGVSGPRAADAAAAGRGRRARRRASTTRRTCCSSAPTRRGDFSPLHAAPRRRRRQRRAAGRVRPAARRGRVLVQGRVPDATSTARPSATARRRPSTRRRSTTSPRTSSRSAAHARPAQPARPGLDRAQPRADVGIALVELLAYVADELSYRQDAVATEAYLQTARRRTSLRRHARLVDYVVHEGCNARAWVRVFVERRGRRARPRDAAAHAGARRPGRGRGRRARTTATRSRREPRRSRPSSRLSSSSRTSGSTSGRGATPAAACPAGATSATLVGDHPELKAGDVLVLAEVVGPETGNPDDADPAKRVAVRLTHVVASSDPSGGLFADPPTNDPVDVTEIRWDEADALPFPLCISVEERPELVVAEAWGNIVLADHGRTIAAERLADVPDTGPRPRAGRLRPVRPAAERACPRPLPADAREGARHPGACPRRRMPSPRARSSPGRRSRPPSRRSPSSRTCTTGSTSAASASRPGRRCSAAATTSGR